MTATAPESPQPDPDPFAGPAASTSRRPAWMSRIRGRWLTAATGIVALLIGVAIGVATGSGTRSDLASTKKQLADAQQTLGTVVPAAEAEAKRNAQVYIASQQADLDKRKQELDQTATTQQARQAQLDTQRQELDAATAAAKASEITGNGVYVVGTDIQPGTYKTAGGTRCYWKKFSLTDDRDIIANDLPGGPTTVTIPGGIRFETQNCGTWTKIG